MWQRYRKWKSAILFPAIGIVTLLSSDQQFDSPRGKVGIGIGVALLVAYLAEEIIWMAQRRGRPCLRCGIRVHVKSFRWPIPCPHCGRKD